MQDPRKPRPLRPKNLSILVMDTNNFTRGLISEILRNLDATNISSARTVAMAEGHLLDRQIDVIMLSWEKDDPMNGLKFVRELRRLPDDRIRRLPLVFITSGLTREFIIAARDAGVDEFLSKPISPAAMRQRLEMVIETPRPFVDCDVYLGPCRRRKNPADYHGEKRRAGERGKARGSTMVDAEEEAAKSPIRVALAGLRAATKKIRASEPCTLKDANHRLNEAKTLAQRNEDHALYSALASYEAYISVAAPLGQIDSTVIQTALNALEQLATLPIGYTEARDSVAIALGKAIQKKLAA